MDLSFDALMLPVRSRLPPTASQARARSSRPRAFTPLSRARKSTAELSLPLFDSHICCVMRESAAEMTSEIANEMDHLHKSWEGNTALLSVVCCPNKIEDSLVWKGVSSKFC